MAKTEINNFANTLKAQVAASMTSTTAQVADKKPVATVEEVDQKKFALRIDGDLYNTLVAISKRDKDSLNKTINKAIAEFIERHS